LRRTGEPEGEQWNGARTPRNDFAKRAPRFFEPSGRCRFEIGRGRGISLLILCATKVKGRRVRVERETQGGCGVPHLSHALSAPKPTLLGLFGPHLPFEDRKCVARDEIVHGGGCKPLASFGFAKGVQMLPMDEHSETGRFRGSELQARKFETVARCACIVVIPS
jgi:hypothetical protein